MSSLTTRSPAPEARPASLTERLAVAVLLRQPAYAPVAPADDPIHLLTPEERQALQRIERGAMLRAALAGALSAGASSAAALVAHHYYPIDRAQVPALHLFGYWGWVLLVTVIASLLEIAFLYFDALRSVHRMASAAGLIVSEGSAQNQHQHVILALVRAALELPNPLKPLPGIDPRRETNAWVIVIVSLLYKAKVAMTTFVIKALLRGALGRVLARAWLELVAVPVTAVWNAVVCQYVLREARLRILGPSAVVELLTEAARTPAISDRGWQAAVRAVASAVVRTHDFHPNHLAILHSLTERISLDALSEADDPQRFIEELTTLAEADQSFVLHVLVIAAVLDGRVTRAEWRLLEQAFTACGRTLDRKLVEDAVRTFRGGRPVMPPIAALCART